MESTTSFIIFIITCQQNQISTTTGEPSAIIQQTSLVRLNWAQFWTHQKLGLCPGFAQVSRLLSSLF